MRKFKLFGLLIFAGLMITSCDTNNNNPSEPQLIFKFKFDSTQTRLNNFGQVAVMPSNHRAQNPRFNKMSAHYIELAPNAFTALQSGEVLYTAPTTSGAIDFDQSVKVGENENFFSMNLKDIAPGTYEWLRVSLAYQNYDINYRVNTPFLYDGTGTLASFIGYNTYINSYTINTQSVAVNGTRLQGYWGFETVGTTITGQVPSGFTTVVNPISSTSPIPAGSCVVTGAFVSPLVITGNETEDIVIQVSLSTNNSFEWVEHGNNNYYEPMDGDTLVDMGVRGMIPSIQ